MLDTASPFLSATVPATAPGAEPKAAFALKRVRRALVACELAPGVEVSEADIAERFGLGRAAVRMALNTLAGERLVSVVVRRGWHVTPISGALIGDVIRARRLLEPALAALRLAPADTAALRAQAHIVAALQSRPDRQALVTQRSTERQLLDLLAARTGGMLVPWLAETWNQSERIVNFFDGAGAHGRPVSRLALVDALAIGDAAAAREQIGLAIDAFQAFATDCLLTTASAIQVGAPATAIRASAAADAPPILQPGMSPAPRER
jgi:DNA-binding GntR family transcriptional regulator